MEEMKLFTKPGCEKCDYVKQFIPASAPVTLYDITETDGLAELAFHELVALAEKELPILLVENRPVTGAIKVKKVFQESC